MPVSVYSISTTTTTHMAVPLLLTATVCDSLDPRACLYITSSFHVYCDVLDPRPTTHH